MLRPPRIELSAQRVGLRWSIDTLEPLVLSLRAQGKIDESVEHRLAELKAIEATLEFLSRPDVEIRKRG